mgnify:CR=1 FL=1|jgi:hypothetical protein
MGRVKDEHLGVLQNIEFALVSTYREHPEMTDWDAMEAVKGSSGPTKRSGTGVRPRLSAWARWPKRRMSSCG